MSDQMKRCGSCGSNGGGPWSRRTTVIIALVLIALAIIAALYFPGVWRAFSGYRGVESPFLHPN